MSLSGRNVVERRTELCHIFAAGASRDVHGLHQSQLPIREEVTHHRGLCHIGHTLLHTFHDTCSKPGFHTLHAVETISKLDQN